MKFFGFLFIIFGWAGMVKGFNWADCGLVVAGGALTIADKMLDHVIYMFKNERLKIERK